MAATLVITIGPHGDDAGESPLTSYLEEFWLPIAGPSTVVLVRHLARRLMVDSYVATTPEDLGECVGLAPTQVRRTSERAAHFGLLQVVTTSEWHLPGLVPKLSVGQLARLPEWLRAEHDRRHPRLSVVR